MSTLPIDRRGAIIAMLLVATATEAMLLLLPIYVGAIIDNMSLSSTNVGLLSSADLLGIALSTLSATWWLRRIQWRRGVVVFLAVYFLANLLTIWTASFPVLCMLRLIAGFSGGAAYAVALAGLCDTTQSDRNTALMVCSQVAFGALGAYLLPLMSADWQISAIFIYINVWTLAAVAAALIAFPSQSAATDQNRAAAIAWRQIVWRALSVSVGTTAYFLAVGMVWAYLERIARSAGMDSLEVSASLGTGYLLSLFGSFAAAWMGTRFGQFKPMMVAGISQLAMLLLFNRLDQFEDVNRAFFLINIVFQFFWSYIVAYQIMAYNDVDDTGQFVATYGTSVHLALAMAPYIGAELVVGEDYSAVLGTGTWILAVCYTAFLLAIYLNQRAVKLRLAPQ